MQIYLHGISKDAKSIPEASRITTLAILILVARLQRYRRDLIITRVLFLAVWDLILKAALVSRILVVILPGIVKKISCNLFH